MRMLEWLKPSPQERHVNSPIVTGSVWRLAATLRSEAGYVRRAYGPIRGTKEEAQADLAFITREFGDALDSVLLSMPAPSHTTDL